MNKTKINQVEIDQLLKNSSSQAESQSKISAKNKKQETKIIGTAKPSKIQKDQTQTFKKDKNRKNKQEKDYGEDFQQQQQKYSKVSSQPIQSNYQGQNFQQTAEIVQQNQSQQNIKTKFPKLQTKNQYQESYQKQKQKKPSEQLVLDQVQSQYASQIIDDVAEQLNQSIGDHQKDKDDQLSLAQSQFIQSGKLNEKSLVTKKVSKQKFIREKKNEIIQVNKNKGAKKQKLKEQTKPKTKPKQNTKKIQNTSQNNQKINKIAVQNKPAKIKRTEDQIKESLQAIQQEKKRIQQQKQKKKQQQLQQVKKIYEQGIEKQKQKRQKNKGIMQEHKKKKKGANSFIKQTKNLDVQVKQIVNKEKSQIKNYKYFQINQQRKKNEKQIINKIQQQNKKKLKQLQIKSQVKKIKGEENKKQFLKIKQNLKQAKINEKKQEDKQQDILLIKKIKKEIAQLRYQNEQKRKKIFQFDKSVEQFKKSLKQKQKQFYSRFNQNMASTSKEQTVTTTNISDLTPIQKFITFFPSAKSCSQIYKILDQNNDQMLSKQQILSKIKRQGVPDDISDDLFKILDRNSDGEITLQQFVFNIESEIQKQIDYRTIMGEIQITDPIDIQAKIIDMRSKISYMDKKIKAEEQNEQSIHDKKSKEYLQKITKIEQQFKKQKQAKSSVTTDMLISDSTPLLLKQLGTLQNQLKMHTKLLQAIKLSFNTNLISKNKTLMLRVQQNLSLKQKLYNLKNQIQQTQLRYLSLKKIEQNKKGYLQKRSKERQQMQQIYMKTQQYQIRIADPTKQSVNRKYARDIQFLAAVIMIQRNFRARKARRLAQQKKNNLTLKSK